ncbi:DUF4235 domain-containing protein [Neorhodopirellula lusitana]|uniref:DUF4235 domain-containing protein n=1 Tax=Neorhodopirellula lusitana TaxID=445327 RepID=UPI00384DEB2E
MMDAAKEKVSEYVSDEPNGRNAGVGNTENVVAYAVALGATLLARNALQAGWRTTMNREPPKNPASHEVAWRDALLWGAVSGAVVGIARIASRRGSSSVYRTLKS